MTQFAFFKWSCLFPLICKKVFAPITKLVTIAIKHYIQVGFTLQIGKNNAGMFFIKYGHDSYRFDHTSFHKTLRKQFLPSNFLQNFSPAFWDYCIARKDI